MKIAAEGRRILHRKRPRLYVQRKARNAKEFDLDFTDGTVAKIDLAEESSSVMLRDNAGALEYAD